MTCLLERLHQAGEEGRLGARQLERMLREEERMREERELFVCSESEGFGHPPARHNYGLDFYFQASHPC